MHWTVEDTAASQRRWRPLTCPRRAVNGDLLHMGLPLLVAVSSPSSCRRSVADGPGRVLRPLLVVIAVANLVLVATCGRDRSTSRSTST
jgi:hypothetical protein